MSLEGWTDIMSARRRRRLSRGHIGFACLRGSERERGSDAKRYAFERTNGRAVAALYFLAVIGVCGIILLNLTLAGA